MTPPPPFFPKKGTEKKQRKKMVKVLEKGSDRKNNGREVRTKTK